MDPARNRGRDLGRLADRLADAPHLLHRRLGPAAAQAGIQRRRLPRPSRPPPDRRPGASGRRSKRPSAWAARSRSRLRPRNVHGQRLLLFVYLRRRVGDWLALAGVAPILFMGTAYEDLLNVFQICYFGSMAFGLGGAAGLRAPGNPRRRRSPACSCSLSLAFAEIAFAFAVACAVTVALRSRPLAAPLGGRAPDSPLPALVHGVGAAGRQLAVVRPRRQQPRLRPRRLRQQPRVACSGLGTPILLGGIGGLRLGTTPAGRTVGAGGVGGLLGYRVRLAGAGAAQRRPSVLVPDGGECRPGSSSGRVAVPVRGRRVRADGRRRIRGRAGARLETRLACGESPPWRCRRPPRSATSRRCTSHTPPTQGDGRPSGEGWPALEIARDSIDPGFVLTPENSDFEYFGYVDAGSYLSPRRSSARRPTAKLSWDRPRERAHRRRQGHGLGPRRVLPAAIDAPRPGGPPAPGRPPRGGGGLAPGCITVRPVGGSPPVVSLPPGGVSLRATGAVPAPACGCGGSRPASFPIYVATLRGSGRLDIPRDRSTRPWQLRLDARGPVTVCAK